MIWIRIWWTMSKMLIWRWRKYQRILGRILIVVRIRLILTELALLINRVFRWCKTTSLMRHSRPSWTSRAIGPRHSIGKEAIMKRTSRIWVMYQGAHNCRQWWQTTNGSWLRAGTVNRVMEPTPVSQASWAPILQWACKIVRPSLKLTMTSSLAILWIWPMIRLPQWKATHLTTPDSQDLASTSPKFTSHIRPKHKISLTKKRKESKKRALLTFRITFSKEG